MAPIFCALHILKQGYHPMLDVLGVTDAPILTKMFIALQEA